MSATVINEMSLPLDFNSESQEHTPPSWRVILIAAAVALVVGALPALAGALIYADNLDAASKGRAADNCALAAEARHLANKRIVLQWEEIQSDITVYQRLVRVINDKTTRGIVADGLATKREEAKQLTLSPPPNCKDLGRKDFKLAKPIPLDRKIVDAFKAGKTG